MSEKPIEEIEEVQEVEPVTDEHDLGEGPPADAEDEFPEEADEQ